MPDLVGKLVADERLADDVGLADSGERRPIREPRNEQDRRVGRFACASRATSAPFIPGMAKSTMARSIFDSRSTGNRASPVALARPDRCLKSEATTTTFS
jgi:hypothetical protein